MNPQLNNPLIVQSDKTLLLEVMHPQFEEVREKIHPFTEIVKSPEYIHTYRMTALSLWNAAARGTTSEQIKSILKQYSKFPISENLINEINQIMMRYGMITLEREGNHTILRIDNHDLLREIEGAPSLKKYLLEKSDKKSYIIDLLSRGILKQELIKLGYPVKDLAGYEQGEHLPISLLPITRSGKAFALRDYQQEAVDSFYENGADKGGSSVLVLPCGAGKTIIGLGIMAEVKSETLILTTNNSSVKQWQRELLDKTTLSQEQIGEYSGIKKEVKPVTVATYQILTHRSKTELEFEHMRLFQQRNWGLIIYDEVHLLPAPIFRYTANIQAKRRLGLTATLVREDQKEEEVFSLIGPKKYDIPWIQMEEKGWIAEAYCREIRVPLLMERKNSYLQATKKHKARIAQTNPLKLKVLKNLLEKHKRDSILIIGQYIEQLEEIAKAFNLPLITGKVTQEKREKIYEAFRKGKIKRLVVSKVANFAIDLPDAKVAIQVSGTFGSRQEEAQRLGRILRPKEENSAFFYSLVSRNTVDQDYAMKRQMFLIEQGYRYEIELQE